MQSRDVDTRSALLIAIGSQASGAPERLAGEASRLVASSLLIFAETLTDQYSIAEYRGGQLLRRISFHRDVDPQWQLEGEPRNWEEDLLLALPCDEFVGYLSDDDTYTEDELIRAERAHVMHDICGMDRRPPLLSASLWEWLRGKGVDPNAPDARC